MPLDASNVIVVVADNVMAPDELMVTVPALATAMVDDETVIRAVPSAS